MQESTQRKSIGVKWLAIPVRACVRVAKVVFLACYVLWARTRGDEEHFINHRHLYGEPDRDCLCAVDCGGADE